jgi:hypothetical protein
MIGTFVTFRYADDFDEQAVRTIADAARVKFDGLPGLRSKLFTVDAAKREARNVYVWDSEEAARVFFTAERLEGVAALYRARPTVEFVQVAALVENIRS